MEDNSKENKSADILGLASYGEAIKSVIDKGFDAASALMGKLCLPAAEELGLMFKDKVRYWRLKNIINIINKMNGKLTVDAINLQLTIHPRIVNEVMESGSFCDDNSLQEMWAGLLASSCSSSNNGDGNFLFTQQLKLLTSIQAKIINYICSNCDVTIYRNNLIAGNKVSLTLEELYNITGCTDIEKLDNELDSLRANELIVSGFLSDGGGGFSALSEPLVAELKPSPLLLALYAKTQGFTGTLRDFYKERLIPYEYKEPGKFLMLGGGD